MLRKSKGKRDDSTPLPVKRIGSGVLLFYKGQLLIIQPAYSSDWLLPGGIVEAEESPLEGLVREVQEDLGITITPTQILSVDYVRNVDMMGEYISFLFAAQNLTEKEAQQIRLASNDFTDFRFVDIDVALRLLAPRVARRVASTVQSVCEGDKVSYLENGHI
ncbi:MAG: NUDIX domain-containing protein [Bacillota bacterium]